MMETWRDIMAEMRDEEVGEYFPFTKFEIKTTPKIRHLLHVLADRIEAACKILEETGRIAIQSAQARHDEEVDALKLENAKLRRALEPVMACDVNSMTMQSELERAVREAQKIMKGESK